MVCRMTTVSNDKEPTDEMKEFWERLGWRLGGIPDFPGTKEVMTVYWVSPDGVAGDLPPIDLNSLFKYAVPKAIRIYEDKGLHTAEAWSRLFSEWLHIMAIVNSDPALALFWAIREVINAK